MMQAVPGPSIFISYRREDAGGDAGRLADHLHRRFGAARVFLDVDTIQPGSDFPRALQSSLQQTAVTLVVIGPRWTSARDTAGNRRLDDPRDFVRLEVETALSRGIPVVPVLVQGASLPRLEDLPESLAPLVTRHAATLDHAEFQDDAERLCDRLAPLIEGPWVTFLGLLRQWWPVAALALAVAGGAAAYSAWRTGGVDAERPPIADVRRSGDVVGPVTTDTSVPASKPGPASPVTPAPSPPTRPSPRNTSRAGGTVEADAALPGRAAAPAVPPADSAAKADAEARASSARDLSRRVDAVLAQAAAQRRRGQFAEALATLAGARELAPNSEEVQQAQEDLAMYWMRNARVQSDRSASSQDLRPALAVIDAALPEATGTRRADLLAHSGWASFLMWRSGNRELDPAEWYREALSLDAANPYANAMLAHWLLFRDGEELPRAIALFGNALKSGRATEAVRALQWSAYGNARTPQADAERVRVANVWRQEGLRLTMEQASALWGPYYSAMSRSAAKEQPTLLAALPPDEYITTLSWAFDAYVASDESRQLILRYYVALLHAAAGRQDQAIADLRALEKALTKSPGSLRDAVQDALRRLQPRR
jgi:hypothetical protein